MAEQSNFWAVALGVGMLPISSELLLDKKVDAFISSLEAQLIAARLDQVGRAAIWNHNLSWSGGISVRQNIISCRRQEGIVSRTAGSWVHWQPMCVLVGVMGKWRRCASRGGADREEN